MSIINKIKENKAISFFFLGSTFLLFLYFNQKNFSQKEVIELSALIICILYLNLFYMIIYEKMKEVTYFKYVQIIIGFTVGLSISKILKISIGAFL